MALANDGADGRALGVRPAPARLPHRPPGAAARRDRTSLPWVFLAPTLALLAVLSLVPTVAAINLALRNRVLRYPDSEYVGLRNFIRLASDRRFLNAIEVSVLWEVVTVAGAVLVGIALAVFLLERVRPLAPPRVAGADHAGAAAARVGRVHLEVHVRAAHRHPELAARPARDRAPRSSPIRISRCTRSRWSTCGNGAVLRGRDPEAAGDAAARAARSRAARLRATWQVHAYITLPMLKAPLVSLVFIKMVESLRSFDLIYVMTKGGPGIATETLDLYAYQQGIGLAGKVSMRRAWPC